MATTTKPVVQEPQAEPVKPDLKAERVQEEIALLAGEPFRISLKAERVQAPGELAAEPGAPRASSAFELNLQLGAQQEVMIAFTAQGALITI